MREVVRPGGYHPSSEPALLVLARGDQVSLPGTSPALALEAREWYTFVEQREAHVSARWRVQLTGYDYALRSPDARSEFLAFHLHPDVPNSASPHLHLGSALLRRPSFATAQIPTGWVSSAEVLRLLIRDLGVRPLRPEWDALLIEASSARSTARATP
ncbi:MAG TPA: hypothetical protein VKV26_05060 [Dehalococcoidia bacterium]|nr:hypothetical protein [Dehalococcoidia bacterium]